MFAPHTPWERFRGAPLSHLANSLFMYISTNTPEPLPKKHIRVVCISDTHKRTPKLPDGDIIIHAGDLSNLGTTKELQDQIDWLNSLPHPQKFAISGNHDSWLDPEVRAYHEWEHHTLSWKSVIYLEDSEHEVQVASPNEMATRAASIYASPRIPQCGGRSYAFQYIRSESHSQWRHKVPASTEILITHTPARYYLDLPEGGLPMGCDGLLEELWRTKPLLHVFGHIHGARGKMVVRWDQAQKAYERASKRDASKSKLGFLELLNIWAWVDLVIIIVVGFWGLAKARMGRDKSEHKSVLVNAAVYVDRHGHLDAPILTITI